MDSPCFVDSNRHLFSSIVPLKNNEKHRVHESDLRQIESLEKYCQHDQHLNHIAKVVFLHFDWFEYQTIYKSYIYCSYWFTLRWCWCAFQKNMQPFFFKPCHSKLTWEAAAAKIDLKLETKLEKSFWVWTSAKKEETHSCTWRERRLDTTFLKSNGLTRIIGKVLEWCM